MFHLDPGLGEVQPHGELLPGEHVRVLQRLLIIYHHHHHHHHLGLLKAPLKLVKLKGGECRPGSLNRQF